MDNSPFAEIVPRCGEIRSDRLPRAKLCCFQQNPTVVTADLDAPMDPDPIYAAACSSKHLLRDISLFAKIVPRCGEIRPDRLPRAKLCCFSANPDRCDSRTRRSDGLRRYELASINFNTLREKLVFVCRDRTALRRNPIRSAPESQIMLLFSKIRPL